MKIYDFNHSLDRAIAGFVLTALVILCAAIGMCPRVAHAQIYGGTTSSGGSTSTGCTATSVPGGIVVATGGACVSTINLTTDNAGAVSVSASVTTPIYKSAGVQTFESQGATTAGATLTNNTTFSTTALVGTTSVTTPLLTNTGALGIRSQGASTDGATVTNNLWTFNGAVSNSSTYLTTSATDPAFIITVGAHTASGFGRNGSVGGIDVFGEDTTARWNFNTTTLLGASTSILGFSQGTVAQSIDTAICRGAAGQITLGTTACNGLGEITANNTGAAATVNQRGYVTSGAVLTASAVSLTTATVTSGAFVNLPAGDWDISATYCYTPTGTTTLNTITLGINTTAAGTQPSADTGQFVQYVQAATSVPGANDICITVGPMQVLPTVNNTSYSVISTAVFGTSTLKAHGFIRARRMR